MNYKQLTQDERYHICALKKVGYNQKQIADELNRSKSTISRELKRNKGLRSYWPKQAHERAKQRQRSAKKHVKLNDELKKLIGKLLAMHLSPEQIVGRLFMEAKIKLHHESIYRYIYRDKAQGGELCKYLVRANKKYRKRYGKYDSRGQIIDRISIDARPSIVEKKSRIGDWEGDTIVGKGRKSAIITMVERKTLYCVAARITSKHADITATTLIAHMQHLQAQVLTITFDNGKEFAKHKDIAAQLGADVYFAHPYSSWERGINENTNGLIRRYFPKGSDFMAFSEAEIQAVITKLNHRPRKTRGYKTPYELLTGQTEKLLPV